MNFDGIPELISFKYMDNGSTYFDICTYRNKSIAILYSAYNVIPYEIGTSVSLYNDRGNNGVSVYRCSMFAGGIDCSESEKKKVPEAAGLLTYEAGDILSGRYKDKKASLDYTEPAEKSEYWDLDMDAIYDMLKSGYTTSDVMHRLNVEGLQVSGSSNSSDRFIFDTYIMGHLGEMKYTTSIPLIFSWYTNDYIAGSEFADYYNLEKIGDTNFGNGYIHYTYNELLAIEIKSGKKYGTHVSILLER